ncbi:hypothetical protein ACP4OV_002065 [Aristida adscensionis]
MAAAAAAAKELVSEIKDERDLQGLSSGRHVAEFMRLQRLAMLEMAQAMAMQLRLLAAGIVLFMFVSRAYFCFGNNITYSYCFSALPVDDDWRRRAGSRKRFCRNYMCMICSKFDYDESPSTCHWFRCEVCTPLAHKDYCVIVSDDKQMADGPNGLGTGHTKMLSHYCQACQGNSRPPDWFSKEFLESKDREERKLFRKCAELHARLSSGSDEDMCHEMLLQQLQEMDSRESGMDEAVGRILIDTSADPIELSFSFLERITNEFSISQVIGRGGFGVVYMGVLQNKKIAVKKLSQTRDFSDKQFHDELACLRRVKHKNIVRFLGFCSDTRVEAVEHKGQLVLAEDRRRFLCFEYVPNSLHDYIKAESHGHECDMHYKLIEGICCGLSYLHNKERITHLDLKPENILLDTDMVPKITDFGLSRRFSGGQSKIITKTILGSQGYIAPEYWSKGEISYKADIFSLGIVIRKLLCGSTDSSDLENWHQSLNVVCPQLKRCIEISQLCVEDDPHKRPTIDCIIDMLSEKGTMIEEQGIWDQTFDVRETLQTPTVNVNG